MSCKNNICCLISFNCSSIAFHILSIFFFNKVNYSKVLKGNVKRNVKAFDVIDSNLVINGIHLKRDNIAQK